MAGFKDTILINMKFDGMTVAELCDLVRDKHVSIELTITQDERKVEIYPWRDYMPQCPYDKGPKEGV